MLAHKLDSHVPRVQPPHNASEIIQVPNRSIDAMHDRCITRAQAFQEFLVLWLVGVFAKRPVRKDLVGRYTLQLPVGVLVKRADAYIANFLPPS